MPGGRSPMEERVPVDSRGVSRGIRTGRLELESTGQPVTVGGVLVHPGALVVADGDGVIVVPEDNVTEVIEIAIEIQENDKEGRRRLYDRLGKDYDQTVRPR